MYSIDRTEPELDPDVAEAASDAIAQGRKYATRNPDRLSYHVQENARCVSVAAYDTTSRRRAILTLASATSKR
jgi:hypothetical protein